MTEALKVGDSVRVMGGKNAGLVGRVLNIYHATATMDRRAFVELDLTDGPHRTTLAVRLLRRERAS